MLQPHVLLRDSAASHQPPPAALLLRSGVGICSWGTSCTYDYISLKKQNKRNARTQTLYRSVGERREGCD